MDLYEALRIVLEKWRTRRKDFPSPDQSFVQGSVDAALQRLLLEPGLDPQKLAAPMKAGVGEWIELKNEAKRVYKYENGEVKEIIKPVKIRYVQSGHELLCESGDSTVIQTNHDDKDRRLLWYDIIREKK